MKHETAVWAARGVSLLVLGVAYVTGNADDFGLGRTGLAWLGLAYVVLAGAAQYLPRPLGEPRPDE